MYCVHTVIYIGSERPQTKSFHMSVDVGRVILHQINQCLTRSMDLDKVVNTTPGRH